MTVSPREAVLLGCADAIASRFEETSVKLGKRRRGEARPAL
jgi:hypothetical protein